MIPKKIKDRLLLNITVKPLSTLMIKTPKGTQDLNPLQYQRRVKALEIATKLCEQSGFCGMDTPVFEIRDNLKKPTSQQQNSDTLNMTFDLRENYNSDINNKTTEKESGEAQDETYSLRYDQTVPFARYVRTNGITKMKRFQVGKVYRRDQPNILQGRFREFMQFDVDILGAEYDIQAADVELLTLLIRIVTEILNNDSRLVGSEIIVKVNDRNLLGAVCLQFGIKDDEFGKVCSSIDKLDKLSVRDVIQDIVEKGIESGRAKELVEFVKKTKLSDLSQIHSGMANDMKDKIDSVNNLLSLYQVNNFRLVFDLSLARGLDYYTGLIFEVTVDKKLKSKIGSIAGGGRYDKLCGDGLNCVGFSLGIDRLCSILSLPEKHEVSVTVWIVQITESDDENESYLRERVQLVAKFRSLGISADTELRRNTGIGLQMKHVLKNDIPFIIFVGKNEIESGLISVKCMAQKSQSSMTFEESVDLIRTSKTSLI